VDIIEKVLEGITLGACIWVTDYWKIFIVLFSFLHTEDGITSRLG